MEKKNNETNKFHIKDLFTNKQYRSIMILVFYVILFAVLIVGLRNSNTTSSKEGGTVHKSSLDGYELIDGKNFSYKYTVQIDDQLYDYDGKKYNNKDLVNIKKNGESRDYYLENDNVYIKDDDIYRLTLSKPIMIFDFFNTDILDVLITRSTLDESEGKYVIDNQTLYDILNDDSIRVEKGDNFISLEYKNSYITKIYLELTNYANAIGEKRNNATITLDYFDFNLIDDFNEIHVD